MSARCGRCRRRCAAMRTIRRCWTRTIGYYHERLKQSPEALAYLAQARHRRSEAIDGFRLGFADRTLGLRLPDKRRKAGRRDPRPAGAAGAVSRTGHEHFNGSLVMPIIDAAGPGHRASTVARSPTGCAPGTPHAPVSAGPASRRVERLPASLASNERDDPLRGADRRADLLVRRLPQRHGLLWRSRASPPIIWPRSGARHPRGR